MEDLRKMFKQGHTLGNFAGGSGGGDLSVSQGTDFIVTGEAAVKLSIFIFA